MEKHKSNKVDPLLEVVIKHICSGHIQRCVNHNTDNKVIEFILLTVN